jgi:hypothetical protein
MSSGVKPVEAVRSGADLADDVGRANFFTTAAATLCFGRRRTVTLVPYSESSLRNEVLPFLSARLLAFTGPRRFIGSLCLSTMTRCFLLRADDEYSDRHRQQVHHDF